MNLRKIYENIFKEHQKVKNYEVIFLFLLFISNFFLVDSEIKLVLEYCSFIIDFNLSCGLGIEENDVFNPFKLACKPSMPCSPYKPNDPPHFSMNGQT